MEAPAATGDRFFVVSPEDRRGTLWVVSILCCAYNIMIAAIRLFAKDGIGAFSIDDWTAIVATATGLVQSILIFLAIATGMGRDYDDISASQASTIGRLTVASYALIILTEFLTKCSVLGILRRLLSPSMRSQQILCDSVLGACTLWLVSSILVLLIRCAPLEQIGYRTNFCSGLVTRWAIVGIVDSASEILMLVLAVFIIWPLKLAARRKAVVLCSFIPRILLILLIVPHIVSLSHSTQATSLRGASLAVPAVYLQVQMLYAIFSASVPAFNRWLRKFDTSMGTQWQSSSYDFSRGSQGRGASRWTGPMNEHSFQMKSFTSANDAQRTSQAPARASLDRQDDYVPQPNSYRVNVEAQGGLEPGSREGSQGSTHSQSNIIRKETRWYVAYTDE